MKITVETAALARAISLAGSVVERRNTIPILSNLRLHANGVLAVEGTDLDICTRVELPYKGKPGLTLLPNPAKVVSALRRSGAGEVRLHDVDGRLGFVAGAMTANLVSSLPADEWPGGDFVAEERFACTFGGDAMAAIKRIMPAISTEETRYYLNGVRMRRIDEWLWRLDATDGHRLMMADVALPDAVGDLPDSFIMPRAFLRRALAAFAKTQAPIRFAVGPVRRLNAQGPTLELSAGLGRVSMTGVADGLPFAILSKVIDGTYPDVQRVVPPEAPYSIRCRVADLRQAVLSLSALGSDKVRAIKLTFVPDAVVCSLHSADLGEGSFTIAAQHNAPSEFTIGFNGRYAVEMLGALSGEEVVLGLTDPTSPALVNDPADTAFTGVLMPMRV